MAVRSALMRRVGAFAADGQRGGDLGDQAQMPVDGPAAFLHVVFGGADLIEVPDGGETQGAFRVLLAGRGLHPGDDCARIVFGHMSD